jgi:hypothetical protein
VESFSKDYHYVLAFTFAAIDGERVARIRVREFLDLPGATPEQIDNFKKVLEFLEDVDFDDPLNWPRRLNPNPTDDKEADR